MWCSWYASVNPLESTLHILKFHQRKNQRQLHVRGSCFSCDWPLCLLLLYSPSHSLCSSLLGISFQNNTLDFASILYTVGRYRLHLAPADCCKFNRRKLFAIFSLWLSISPWNFSSMLPVYIYIYSPILDDLSQKVLGGGATFFDSHCRWGPTILK